MCGCDFFPPPLPHLQKHDQRKDEYLKGNQKHPPPVEILEIVGCASRVLWFRGCYAYLNIYLSAVCPAHSSGMEWRMNSCTLLEIIAVRSESAVHLHGWNKKCGFWWWKIATEIRTELHINFRSGFRFDSHPPLFPPTISLQQTGLIRLPCSRISKIFTREIKI